MGATNASIPQISNVIPVSSDEIRFWMRWQVHLERADETPHTVADAAGLNPSFIFRLDRDLHSSAEFKSLGNQSGWMIARRLDIKIPPRTYLLCAAINDDGRWVDCFALEQLFDHITAHPTYSMPPRNIQAKLDHGISWHLQLSLANCQPQRKSYLRSVEQEIRDDFSNKVGTVEERLRRLRQAIHTETCSEAMHKLITERDRLRKALERSEDTENEFERHLLQLHASPLEYYVTPLFIMEWAVVPPARARRKHK